jgi:hypothetical protein
MKDGSGNGACRFNFIWAPFRTQIMLGVSMWGQSGTTVKDRDSDDLVSEYVAQRDCCKA